MNDLTDTRYTTLFAVGWGERAFTGTSEQDAIWALEEHLSESLACDGELFCGDRIDLTLYRAPMWCGAPSGYEDCYCGGTHADVDGGSFLVGWEGRRPVQATVSVVNDWVTLEVSDG